MQINLNEIVTYKLTSRGEEILAVHTRAREDLVMQSLGSSVQHEYRKAMVEGIKSAAEYDKTRMQLWEFMKVFGPHMQMGVTPVTEGNLISIGEEKA